MSILSRCLLILGLAASLSSMPALVSAMPFSFTTGNPNGLMGSASRPGTSASNFEIESADDFVLTQTTSINRISFFGILVNGGVSDLDLAGTVLEMYRVFPLDSDVNRTPNVPTRMNSPSDVEFVGRDTSEFTITDTTIIDSFTVANSVTPGGVHLPPPGSTGGNGQQSGVEVRFDVTLTDPFFLPAGHYFFVPQIEMTTGFFLWLSAARPIMPPNTPFPPGSTDLQSWTRDAFLDPDWLRIGTDIVGGTTPPTFNAAFSLSGETIPLPSPLILLSLGMALMIRRTVSSRRATSRDSVRRLA